MTRENKLKDLILERLEIPVYKFCKVIGVSRPTIDNILNKNEFNPSLMTVKKICKYFDVDFKEYL